MTFLARKVHVNSVKQNETKKCPGCSFRELHCNPVPPGTGHVHVLSLTVDRWTHPCWDLPLCRVATMKAEGCKHGLLWVTTSPRSQALQGSRKTSGMSLWVFHQTWATCFFRNRLVDHHFPIEHQIFLGQLRDKAVPRWHHGIHRDPKRRACLGHFRMPKNQQSLSKGGLV